MHDRSGTLLNGPHLEQRLEGRSTNGTIVRLVAQRIGTGIAETQVTTRQDQRVPHVAHTNHTLAARVLRIVVRRGFVQILVLDAVDLLQQIAQTVHKDLLFERPQGIRAIRMVVHDADRGVRLADLLRAIDIVLDYAVNGNRDLLLNERQVLIGELRRTERVIGLREQLVYALFEMVRFRGQGGVPGRINHAPRRDVLGA